MERSHRVERRFASSTAHRVERPHRMERPHRVERPHRMERPADGFLQRVLMNLPSQPHRRPPLTGLDIHVGAVIVLGVVTLATSIHSMATTPPPLNALLFAAFGLLAGVTAVKIPGVSALVSASDTFFIASAMIFGPGPAMV